MEEFALTTVTIFMASCGAIMAFFAGLVWFVVRMVQAYNQSRVRNRLLNQKLQKARTYRSQIRSMIEQNNRTRDKARFQSLLSQVDEWTEAIENLVRRVDTYKNNRLIKKDINSTKNAIQSLEFKLKREDDASVRQTLETTLTNHRTHLESLSKLDDMMNRAELEIEQTISSLGIIYSQVLSGESTNHVADYQHLTAEVGEEVNTLRDYLEAIEEVRFEK